MANRVRTRPRTKVYSSNYEAGESYYKSALDGLDRKYGRSPAPSDPAPASNGTLSSLRASLERDIPAPRRQPILDDDDLEIPRRKPNSSALLNEFDSIFEGRIKNGTSKEKTSFKALDDGIDEEFNESMKRIRASRAARAAADDLEEIESSLSSRKREVKAKKLDFSSQIIDSVGVKEESSKSRGKKILSMITSPDDSEDLTRWTAVKSGRRNVLDDDGEESAGQVAAAARARKSRARLEDLEAEMSALEERGAAREKRLRDLRTLLSENESASQDTLKSTVRVKSTVKTEKKVVSF